MLAKWPFGLRRSAARNSSAPLAHRGLKTLKKIQPYNRTNKIKQ
jgi:hypothetical protein